MRGIERINGLDKEILSNYLNLMQCGDLFLKTYAEYLLNGTAAQSSRADDVKKFADFAEKIRAAAKECVEDLIFVYICANAYPDDYDDREKILLDVLSKIIAYEKITMSVINNNITRLVYISDYLQCKLTREENIKIEDAMLVSLRKYYIDKDDDYFYERLGVMLMASRDESAADFVPAMKSAVFLNQHAT